LLSVCCGSSLDQQSNNVTLFNLVEQINLPPGAPPPPRGVIPLEIHAYFMLEPTEVKSPFEVRYVMLASSGLETPSESFTHRSPTQRYRTRSVGVPFPPVVGHYELCLDQREPGDSWQRAEVRWPINIVEGQSRPEVTH
jgi:hypothetical protein